LPQARGSRATRGCRRRWGEHVGAGAAVKVNGLLEMSREISQDYSNQTDLFDHWNFTSPGVMHFFIVLPTAKIGRFSSHLSCARRAKDSARSTSSGETVLPASNPVRSPLNFRFDYRWSKNPVPHRSLKFLHKD
jgi:hypothetical protein